MTKRLKDEMNKNTLVGKPMSLNIISLVLIFACVLLIIFATFLDIPFDYGILLSKAPNTAVYNYIPQVPVIMFIATILGARMGCFSTLLYIFVGMFFPIFALGGGIQYILEPGFGYILSYIPAVIITGLMLRRNTNFLSIFRAALVCTLIIHFCGLIYALLVMMLSHSFFGNVADFVLMQSSLKLLIDLIFCIITAYIGLMIKKAILIFVD